MSLSQQIKQKVKKHAEMKRTRRPKGNSEKMISTGSTLLDLAISGGRVRGGGIPGGILVEIFGPSSSGKTVLLCEIAGAVSRQGGEIMFHDPEARLNKQFARLFDLNVDDVIYTTPSTVPEIFEPVRNWTPKARGKVNGIFADSLAALSTEMELEEKDAYGMRRAKEFSEELRKTCRTLTEKNFLMVTSNQIRENIDAGSFGQKYKSPGGMGIGFYSSLRLRAMETKKLYKKVRFKGKEVKRVIGVETIFEVFKSSVWNPYRRAPVTIIFNYGIDDIRQNLQFIKTYSSESVYMLGGDKLSQSMESSIEIIEEDDLEDELRNEVIDLWERIESEFEEERKPKRR